MVKNFQKEMLGYVLGRLSGSHDLDETTYTQPSKRFILGSLAPKRNKNLNVNEEQDDPLALRETEHASIRARQLRVSVLVSQEQLKQADKIQIIANGSFYYQINIKPDDNVDDEAHKNDEKFEKSKQCWKRIQFSIPIDIMIGSAQKNNLDLTEIRNKINSDPFVKHKITDDVWKADVRIATVNFTDESVLLHFYITNIDVEDPPGKRKYERTIFDCSLEVDLGKIITTEFQDEYYYDGFKQRYYYYFRTINCQAFWLDSSRKKFRTRHYDTFNQPNIIPKIGLSGINLSFEKLSENDGINELKNLFEKMELRRSEYNSRSQSVQSEFQERDGCKVNTWSERKRRCEQFSDTIGVYKRGLDILSGDENAKLAFILMNRAFDEYYRNKNDGASVKDTQSDRPSWRLFQIVFIVSSLRCIVKHEDLDMVDVLHVGTGGGKSEAYFGLVVFAMFYERLMGKSDGVTAIVKFPLRMLSIQQLERLSSVIAYAEKVRTDNIKSIGGSEYSLGYYVGNVEDFPGLYSEMKQKLYVDRDCQTPIQPALISKIISKCPLCSSPRGNVILKDDPVGKRILHVCDKNDTHRLFIYLTDREVFRYRPTVIVSTVDKWAGLSQQRRARALLGAKGSLCPKGHGFIPSGDKCEDERDGLCEEIGKNILNSEGPILSIQDEMHLLRESFGSIAGHFEGLIETIVRRNSHDRKIKHIAMSATLNGADKQIKELYNKDTIVLPGPSPEGYGSKTDFFYEDVGDQKRIIYGLKPNFRDNHYASLRTILHIIEFLQNEQKRYLSNKKSFEIEYGFTNEQEVFKTFKMHLIPLTYHLKRQDAEDMNRLTDTVISDELENNYNTRVNGTVLTGARGLDELKDTINMVRESVENYNIDLQIQGEVVYDALFATSVVSHGIDLEELNVMIFQGLPYSTSEYIQALSRVGRKYRGIVILWFFPNRMRDDSFYRNFARYHETLDHMVKPTPINRKSRLATMQTINSIFCAGVMNHLSNYCGKPLFHKRDIVTLDINLKNELVDFIKECYGIPVAINIEQEVELRINQIKQSTNKDTDFFPNVLAESGKYFFRNQSGMRGIQKQLVLEPTNRDVDRIKNITGV